MQIENYLKSSSPREYIKNIDIFRFIFACIIVTCHMLPQAAFLSDNDFNFLYHNLGHLWMCVELFFIISGFMFIWTYKETQNWTDFFKAKIIRMWPVMIFTILLFAILSLFKFVHLYLMEDIFTLFFLNGLRLANHTTPYSGLGNLHPLWFVSCMIYVSVLYRYIIRNYGLKAFGLVLMILIPIGIWIHIDTPGPVYVLITGAIDVSRAAYGMGIGSGIALLYISYKDVFKLLKVKIQNRAVFRMFVNLAEIGIFSYLIFGLCASSKDRLVEGDLILLFIFIFLLMLLDAGILSKLFSQKWAVTLGKYSFSIFCTHSLGAELFSKYYFKVSIWDKIQNIPLPPPYIEILYSFFPVIICVLFGIIVYYLIEMPLTKILKNKYLTKGAVAK